MMAPNTVAVIECKSPVLASVTDFDALDSGIVTPVSDTVYSVEFIDGDYLTDSVALRYSPWLAGPMSGVTLLTRRDAC
jgi:hypothetical protein